jgi:hypothetical protein
MSYTVTLVVVSVVDRRDGNELVVRGALAGVLAVDEQRLPGHELLLLLGELRVLRGELLRTLEREVDTRRLGNAVLQ